ncbi:MAG: hypothetical protein Q8P05_06240 [Candidatus Diapherotrites archaeon]|nr:hypothetical protein [Candidatus Diapherotrites archaeon]MDZ4256307.1 hypothetical protein [archaeon]
MVARPMKIGIFLVLTYVILYLVYLVFDFLPKWDAYGHSLFQGVPLQGYLFVDPLFWGIPLIGFIFVWLGMEWYALHFKDDFVLSIPFALMWVVLGYVAWFFSMVGYYWNNAFLVALNKGDAYPGIVSLSPTIDFVMQNFLDFLLKSPFFLFVLAGLLGWVSFVIIHRYWDEPLPHHTKEAAHTAPAST